MTSKDHTQKGANITQLKEDVKNGVGRINAEKDKRTAANEEIAAIKSDLETKGIPKKALDMAMTYMNMDPDKRQGFDVAYEIVREAIGMPIASDQHEIDFEAEANAPAPE